MKDLLSRDTFIRALNNPGVEDKLTDKEPATIATDTHPQCHETGSPTHLA